jgi:hypothetical protein
MRNLHDVIATDIPERAEPAERAPLEVDEDLTRQDAWMFSPLIATAVAPALVVAALAFGTWRAIDSDQSASAPPPTTFASRWPEDGLPLTMLR